LAASTRASREKMPVMMRYELRDGTFAHDKEFFIVDRKIVDFSLSGGASIIPKIKKAPKKAALFQLKN